MPGVAMSNHPSGGQKRNDMSNGNSPGPNRKFAKTSNHYGTLSYRELWSVKNREDYTPALRNTYDVKFLPGTDSVVVAEGSWPYSRLQIFNKYGRTAHIFGEGLVLPFGITFSKDSHIVVTDHRDRTVKFYSQEGKQVHSWSESQFEWPNGIAVDQRDQYVIADWSKGLISINNESGTCIRSFKCFGREISEYSCPEYIVIDAHHRIIVTDAYDHCVKVFDDKGAFLFKFGHENGEGHISDPRGVCIDGHGDIVVADWGQDKVSKYSADGRWICDLLSESNAVNKPWGLHINDIGLLALSEQNRVNGPALKMFSCDEP